MTFGSWEWMEARGPNGNSILYFWGVGPTFYPWTNDLADVKLLSSWCWTSFPLFWGSVDSLLPTWSSLAAATCAWPHIPAWRRIYVSIFVRVWGKSWQLILVNDFFYVLILTRLSWIQRVNMWIFIEIQPIRIFKWLLTRFD